MPNKVGSTSIRQSAKALWHALFIIIPMIFRWIWFVIKNIRRPKIKKSATFWDMVSEYLDTITQNEGLKQAAVRRDEKLKKFLKTSDNVLDYGCANGVVAIENADRVKKIIGIDFSTGMIDAAKRKSTGFYTEKLEFMQATIFDERLATKSFDVVLAWGILHLLEERPKVIERIHDLLQPGGMFISATECMGEKKTAITWILRFLMNVGLLPKFLKFFSVTELKTLITDGKFKIVETEILNDNPVACFIAAKKT
jgi:ubiquinone/menaquinone biosynthesis C-methylase UbiE